MKPPFAIAAAVLLASATASAQSPRDDVRCLAAGTFEQGHAGSSRPDEGPVHHVSVGAFCLDATLVTRGAFGRFVTATGHVTEAERTRYGTVSYEGFEDWAWQREPHASWRRPFGVENDDTRTFLRDDAPVVLVSFDDAVAYCAWSHGRPTEAEWEYAMRAGSAGTRFPWGASPMDAQGRPRLNFWQGASHAHNDRADGWVYVSPVRAFAPNAWGFYDAVGNVWQWTSDAYRRDAYAAAARGIDAGASAGAVYRVVRGGSWWCGHGTCDGFGLWYRGHNLPRSSFTNLGFRCAYDAAPR